MSHIHTEHAAHGHAHVHAHDDGRPHAHTPRAVPEASGSLLRASAAARFGVAAAMVALIWTAVFWAVS